MRVISGTAKGRQLKGPPGQGTRPMTDRLKTSLFNILAPFGFEGNRVLDLYAGTGSLGIEMLSRGAAWADFVEQNASVCRIIADNLKSTGLAARARVHNITVARFLAMKSTRRVDSPAEYDIILLDPPYADPAISDTLEAIAHSNLLVEDGLVVIGHANRVKLQDEYGGGRIRRVRQRAMGDSAFSIYTSGRQATRTEGAQDQQEPAGEE
jgi:16S rRNA (guanine966-N2)-methyltransferase